MSRVDSPLPPALIEFVPRSKRRQNAWMEEDDTLWLLTQDELEQIPDGQVLTCITGRRCVVGTDYIDNDTRGGYLAYGFRESQLPRMPNG